MQGSLNYNQMIRETIIFLNTFGLILEENKELKALFGFDRSKLVFQNGADNLIDVYFGINNNIFNLSVGQRKLEKKED